VRLVARVRQWVRRVHLPTSSITRHLRCLHHRRRPCNLVGRTWLPSARARELRASWRLLCPTTHARELRASWRLLCPTARAGELRASWRLLCPTNRPWHLRGSRLWPTARSWQLGASWLRPCSLLSPRGWRASKLRPCELILRLQSLQLVEGQVVVAGRGHSGLVVRKSANAGVVSWKK
jgi:hypothetical protein